MEGTLCIRGREGGVYVNYVVRDTFPDRPPKARHGRQSLAVGVSPRNGTGHITKALKGRHWIGCHCVALSGLWFRRCIVSGGARL